MYKRLWEKEKVLENSNSESLKLGHLLIGKASKDSPFRPLFLGPVEKNGGKTPDNMFVYILILAQSADFWTQRKYHQPGTTIGPFIYQVYHWFYFQFYELLNANQCDLLQFSSFSPWKMGSLVDGIDHDQTADNVQFGL